MSEQLSDYLEQLFIASPPPNEEEWRDVVRQIVAMSGELRVCRKDSERLDKLDEMKPATLGEVLCQLSRPGARIRNVLDKLEETP